MGDLRCTIEPKGTDGLTLSLEGNPETDEQRRLVALLRQGPISDSQSVMWLQKLSGWGALYFRGKRVIADFFSPAALTLKVEKESADSWSVRGWVSLKQGELALDLCDYVGLGDPPWIIVNGVLRLLDDWDWKWLKKVRQAPWILSGESYEEFTKLVLAKEVGLPPVILPQINVKPWHPALKLVDRKGIFADLLALREGEDLKQARKVGEAVDGITWSSFEADLTGTGYEKKSGGVGGYCCPTNQVADSLQLLLESGWRIYDPQGKRLNRQEEIEVTIQSSPTHLLVKGKIRFGDEEVPVERLIAAYQRRESFIELASGQVGLLPKDPGPLAPLLSEDVLPQGIKLRRSHVGALAPLADLDGIHFDLGLKRLMGVVSGAGQSHAPPGEAFVGTLRPYQQQGVDRLSLLQQCGLGALLADDMGLGKTVQVMALLSRMDLNGPVLIVVPRSLLFNWKSEISRFLPDQQVFVYHGSNRQKWLNDSEVFSPGQIVLTSYATVRLDLAHLQEVAFTAIVCDEAQVIKNPTSQTAQAVFSLKGDFRLAMSGTPVENRLSDLWSIFRFVEPDLLGTQENFAEDLVTAQSDGRFLRVLQQRIRPFVIRRRKEEVALDLPPKIEQVVTLEMDEVQRQLYDSILATLKSGLLEKVAQEGLAKNRMEVLEGLLRLRQACCHPVLLSGKFDDVDKLSSSKLDFLLSELETLLEEGAQVIVYSQFTSMLSLIAHRLEEQQWRYARLDGKTADRERVVAQFQKGEVPIFLVSLKTGGVGLNLTAADYVYLYDPWWNRAAEAQAIDRTHRIGQTKRVIAKRLIIADSVEQRIQDLQEKKALLASGILDEEVLSDALTIEDLVHLIQG